MGGAVRTLITIPNDPTDPDFLANARANSSIDPPNINQLVRQESKEINGNTLFNTIDAAAENFGEIYNATSIKYNVEIGTRVFSTNINRRTQYYYATPFTGTKDSILELAIPIDGTVATLHTHAAYANNYDNNDFSPEDIRYLGGDYLYVATPNGSLIKYNKETHGTSILSTSMPSDVHDPTRMNQIGAAGSGGKIDNLWWVWYLPTPIELYLK